MSSYILHRQSVVATVKQLDMTAEMISLIFQVQKETLFLTGDNSMHLFPLPNGHFNLCDFVDGERYEVHGSSTNVDQSSGVPQSVKFFSHPQCTGTNGSCFIARRAASRTFVRSVIFADLIHGIVQACKKVTVHFTESEACVATITQIVKGALRLQGPIILTNTHGKKIIDSKQTQGAAYWMESTRKVFAMHEEHGNMLLANKRRRLRKLKLYFSHEAENGLQEVTAKLQDVVNADQGLEDVSETVKNLCGFAHSTLCFSEAEITSLQEGFCCLVCRSPLYKPMFSTCCRSLIGCNTCVMKWNESHTFCPKCRAKDLKSNIHEVAGLCEALVPLHKLLQ